MRCFVRTMLIVVTLFICSGVSVLGQETDSKEQDKEIKIEKKTEYELIVIDPGFEGWYSVRNVKAKHKSEAYYKNWNHRYAIEWNRLYRNGARNIDSDIDYDVNADYGFELNHKLYYYFLFWEETNGKKLIKRGVR